MRAGMSATRSTQSTMPVRWRCGHGVVLGLVRVLGDGQAAALLDALDADGPVAVRAREHDGRRVGAVGVGQRAEEQVHRHALAALRFEGGQAQVAVDHEQVLGRRDDVHVVGLQTLGVLRRAHGHGGRLLEQLGQGARVLGRKVQDDHVGHAAVGGSAWKNALSAWMEPAEPPRATTGIWW